MTGSSMPGEPAAVKGWDTPEAAREAEARELAQQDEALRHGKIPARRTGWGIYSIPPLWHSAPHGPAPERRVRLYVSSSQTLPRKSWLA